MADHEGEATTDEGDEKNDEAAPKAVDETVSPTGDETVSKVGSEEATKTNLKGIVSYVDVKEVSSTERESEDESYDDSDKEDDDEYVIDIQPENFDIRVAFIIGGLYYETTLATLLRCPNTRLGRLAKQHTPEHTEPYFFNRNPRLFASILHYYRHGNIRPCCIITFCRWYFITMVGALARATYTHLSNYFQNSGRC